MKTGSLEQTRTLTDCYVKMKAEIGRCFYKPKNAQDCQKTASRKKLGEGLDRFSLGTPEGAIFANDTLISDFQPQQL